MSTHSFAKLLLSLAFLSCVTSALAQQPPTNFQLTPYGPPVSVETARKAATAALAEARKNNWLMAVAVVDPSGNLVYYEKMDNTQLGSAKVAVGKARSAALFKRPTKLFQDAVAGGGAGLRVLGLEGAVPVEGGVPLIVDGKIIGAIGLSGDTSDHDGQCARAGADAIQKP
jgi:glc operon protein GlcG